MPPAAVCTYEFTLAACLPLCWACSRLIQKHAATLDANIASRFIATYPSPSKALAALQQCAVSVQGARRARPLVQSAGRSYY